MVVDEDARHAFDADDDGYDSPNASDNDVVSTDSKKTPYPLRSHKHVPNAADYYAASPNDDASPDSLIYSKLKHKIEPRSMIKQKKLKGSKLC